MNKTPRKYLVVLAIAIILAVSLLFWTKPVKQPETREIPPTRVAVVQVLSQDIYPTDKVTGRLQASRKTVLHFELAGPLAERKVEPGARVQAGEVLLRLADADYQNAVVDAKAALQQEQAAITRDRQLLALATREQELQAQAVARLERLGRDSLVSQTARDEAQSRLLQLQADGARMQHSVATGESRLQQREATLSRAQHDLERTQLSAPLHGIVNQVYVQLGDYVAPNVPVLELLNVGELDLYAEVTGATAAALQLSQKVSVRIAEEERQGELVAVQTDPNPTTNTHAIRIRLSAQGWLPGELAEVNLALAQIRGARVVPISAVLQEEGKSYVFLVKNGMAQRTEVSMGVRVKDLQVINAGVSVGDQIVARNLAALADGERVEVEASAPASSPPGEG